MKQLVFSISIKEKKKKNLQLEWFSKWELIKIQYKLTKHEQLILTEQVFIMGGYNRISMDHGLN